MDRRIFTVYGRDARDMTLALLDAANVSADIPAGASIALKPNLVVAQPPENGATTHAGVLEGAIEYLLARGHSDISIIEGAWVGASSTARGFSVCGYDAIAKRYGVPFYDLKKDRTVPVETPIGAMQVCRRALEADFLISMPVLKGHCQTVMTCALKNNKGCLPDGEKRRFHALGLHRPIAALSAVLRPSLYLVDSISGDLSFEEGGTPVETCRMLLGRDPVQLDAYGCRLMGVDPAEVGYIGLAEQFGAGSAALHEDALVFLNEPSDAPVYPARTGLVSRLTRAVEQRAACSACYGNLVHALYRMEKERHTTFREPIRIGQGFAGERFEGVGIGRCCNGASRCVMGCPPSAEAILRALTDG